MTQVESTRHNIVPALEAWDNPEAFAKRYLSHYLTAQPAKFHGELYSMMADTSKNKREAVAAPRGHGKSVLMCLVYPLWAICTGRKRFVVIVSSSGPIAEGFLAGIGRELENNALLRLDFGNLVGFEKWTAKEILTASGVRVTSKGAGAGLRGLRSFAARPDLVICDDLEDDESVQNPEQRKKLEAWFKAAVLNLPGPEGDVFVIGTILHYDSLLSKLLKRWQGKKYRALGSDGSAIWPDYYNAERLKKIKYGESDKEGIGSIAFETEFQNNPIRPEEQLVREEWIKYYQLENLKGQELLVATAIDPAIGSATGDYTAILTVGQAGGKIYVLEADIKRRTPKAASEAAVRNFQKWSCEDEGFKPHFLCLAVETNFFQVVLKDMLEEISRREKLFVPILGIKTFRDKAARIASLSALVESGTILFRRDQGLLIEQLIQFPKGAHDDGPDALEMAVRQVRHHAAPRIRFI